MTVEGLMNNTGRLIFPQLEGLGTTRPVNSLKLRPKLPFKKNEPHQNNMQPAHAIRDVSSITLCRRRVSSITKLAQWIPGSLFRPRQ